MNHIVLNIQNNSLRNSSSSYCSFPPDWTYVACDITGRNRLITRVCLISYYLGHCYAGPELNTTLILAFSRLCRGLQAKQESKISLPFGILTSVYALSAVANPVSLSHRKAFLGILEEYCLCMEAFKRLLDEALRDMV